MKIVFSRHILKDKLPLLKRHGFKITRSHIQKIITHPEHIDRLSDHPKIIISGSFSTRHVLRVVYKIENGIIKVITCYPAEKGRYY